MWILVVLLKRNDPFKDYSHIGNKYWGCYVYGFSVWNIHHVWWKQKNRWWLWFLLIEYSVNTQPSVPIWSYVELNMFAMSANVDPSSHAAMLRWLFLLLINRAILGYTLYQTLAGHHQGRTQGAPAPLPSKPASKFNLTSNYLTQKLKQNKQTNKQINKKILANSILRNNIILCFSFFFWPLLADNYILMY